MSMQPAQKKKKVSRDRQDSPIKPEAHPEWKNWEPTSKYRHVMFCLNTNLIHRNSLKRTHTNLINTYKHKHAHWTKSWEGWVAVVL